MPFLPFAATAKVGGVVGAAVIGKTIYDTKAATTQVKKAAAHQQSVTASAQRAAQEADLKSKAQAEESRRAFAASKARSQTIFTSPLGLTGQATVARKKLLGE